MKKYLGISLFVICLALSAYSSACSCAQKSIEEYYAEAETVFFGRITDAALLEGDDSLVNTGNRMVEAHYEVKELFKGEASSGGRVFYRETNGANCSAEVVVSGYYIVFISKNLMISDCNGTQRFTAPAQLEELRRFSSTAS